MNSKLPIFLLCACLLPSVAYAQSRRRAVEHPGTPWFHAFVIMVPPPGDAQELNLIYPYDTFGLEDPTRVTLKLRTRAGEVTEYDKDSYCFCSYPPGTGRFSLIFLRRPNTFLPEWMPGIIEYRYSFTQPSGRHGEVALQIWADDGDHWHPVGGPVTSYEKRPSGGIVVYGVFLSPPTVRLFDPLDPKETVGGRTIYATEPGGAVEISTEELGTLPQYLSLCSATSTFKPNSLYCSVLRID
jgi:hypothetical protein